MRNAVTPVWVRLKPGCDDVDWDQALDDEVANRFWAYQHPRAAAEDFGISYKCFVARCSRLGLRSPMKRKEDLFVPPLRARAQLVGHYDPSVIAANIAEHGFVKRECNNLKGWWFWGKRTGDHTSGRHKTNEANAGKRAGKCAERLAAIRNHAGVPASIALPSRSLGFAY